MTVDDLRNFVAMFPNHFPALAHVRNVSRRPKIRAQHFVTDKNKTNFAHKSALAEHVQLPGLNRFANGGRQTGQV